MELNRLEIHRARQDYKRNNAIMKLAGKKPATDLELILAEYKLMDYFSPTATTLADKVTNASKSLKYYRKKYNYEGVTRIFERFSKSKPFIKARTIMQAMVMDAIKDVLKVVK